MVFCCCCCCCCLTQQAYNGLVRERVLRNPVIVSVRQWCLQVASLLVWSWKAFNCVDHLTCIEELIFGATMPLNLSMPLRGLASRQIVVFNI